MNTAFTLNDIPGDMTALTFQDYLYRLSLLAQSVFKWNGLPNGIDEKHLERYLFNDGRAMFFKDPNLGWMITKVSDAGKLNFYDEPTKIAPIATDATGISVKRYTPGEDTVLIYNNDYGYATVRTILGYAARLTEMQRTIDINVNAQKTPVILYCSDKTKKSAMAVYNQWKGYSPLIVGDKALNQEVEMKAINISAPVVFDKLAIEKNKIWNECMTFLGINNANMDKRERLVDDEVQANNEQIGLSAHVMLKARQRAAEQMSAMCGEKITVEIRTRPAPVLGALEGTEGGGAE